MFNYLIETILRTNPIDFLISKEKMSSEVKEYMERLYNKLRLTKNLIFRNEPISFYENYIPLTLKNPSNNIRVTDAIELLKRYEKIGIIGSAGSGKSTLSKYIALNCLEEEFGIPVIIELRSYDPKYSLEDFVALQISEKYHLAIKALFKGGKFVFILDGYDEIDYIKGSSFINQIDNFVSRYSANKFVISSRPGTNVESLLPFYIFYIEPLNQNDIFLFINKINISAQLQEKIFKAIIGDNLFRDILNVPLFLYIYILTFDSWNNGFIHKRSIFFRKIIDALFSQHDSVSKLGYVREKTSGLSADNIEEICSILAFRIFFSSKYQLSKDEIYHEFEIIKKTNLFKFENDKLLYDLTITVNLLSELSNYFSFQHILIIEYLTSLFISKLNERMKEDCYSKIINKKSFKLSLSFFDFLYELDHSDFIKYFFIPTLEDLINKEINPFDSEYTHYNFFVLIDFIEKHFNLPIEPSDKKITYYKEIDEIVSLVNKLKREVMNNSNSNSSLLFDILN